MAKKRSTNVSLSSPKARLAALRRLMRDAGVAAYLVPSTDPHQGEYVPTFWERRSWLSGFTGSAGDLVITHTAAGLWTDGRYYLQAGEELRGSGIRLFKAPERGTPSQRDWLAKTLKKGQRVGFDPRLLSIQQHRELEGSLNAAGVKLKAIDRNLVDQIWTDAPAPRRSPIMVRPKSVTGEATTTKLRRVRKEMKEAGADAHVVTTLDSIAWLFNIRGSDVDFNPVVIAHAVVTAKNATLYVDPAKVPPALAKKLGPAVKVRAYTKTAADLRALGRARKRVWLDPATCNAWVASLVKGAKLVEKTSPIPAMKARKNRTEIAGMASAHVRDGVAMVRFLRWLEEAVPEGGVTELNAADQLEVFRREGDRFVGLSFRTISGYAGHGAIIHYSVTPETSVPLKAKGIYLVDSGGQYLDGTTDITRTVLLGKSATREQRDRFTRVLKGHIRLGRAIFPEGVAGIRLDTLARTALWDAGLDYGHGTGHGVGAFLNVHEGPQSISVRGMAHIEAGNVLSNEPGFYRAGAYGIRIENLVVVTEAPVGEGDFLCFETLTLCPIDTRLIERRLLDANEVAWLNGYHRTVYKTLAPLVPAADRRWLKQATRAL